MPTIAAKQHHLSPDQVDFFDQNGYLILRNWIGGEMLERLQLAGKEWIALGENLREGDDRSDFAFAQRANGEVFFRVDYIHSKGQIASLELLGSPEVLGVAESLCGPNFVPTYESMVFKQAGKERLSDGIKTPSILATIGSTTSTSISTDLRKVLGLCKLFQVLTRQGWMHVTLRTSSVGILPT